MYQRRDRAGDTRGELGVTEEKMMAVKNVSLCTVSIWVQMHFPQELFKEVLVSGLCCTSVTSDA